nr:sigma-70 family RNA polymerase sigma factor [Phycicoccus sp. Root101]
MGCFSRSNAWSNSGAGAYPPARRAPHGPVAQPSHPDPSGAGRGPNLQRAEALLEAALACRDATEASRLRHDAVLLCLDLASSCARRYSRRGVEFEDLSQVAHAALVKAANRYVSGKGSGFGAFARATIQGEIKHYFRDCCWAVRPPRGLQESRERMIAEQERLRQELQSEPTATELAASLGWSTQEVDEVMACRRAFRAASLDHVAHGVSGWVDSLLAQDESTAVDNHLALTTCLQSLSDRERRIVHLRFVEEMTQTEIGEELGVSQMQVSRLLSGIVARLRHELDVSGLVA